MDGREAAGSEVTDNAKVPAVITGMLSLPNEMLEMILVKFPCRDQAKLRRVCRRFHQIFPSLCVNPIVQYSLPARKGDGPLKLRRVIKVVTSRRTRTLTIIQPADSRFVISVSIVKDLAIRCPSLKRLILKSADKDTYVGLPLDAARALPGSVELELHDAQLIEETRFSRSRILAHGIFRGPFHKLTVRNIYAHLKQPGFCRSLQGQGILFASQLFHVDEAGGSWLDMTVFPSDEEAIKAYFCHMG